MGHALSDSRVIPDKVAPKLRKGKTISSTKSIFHRDGSITYWSVHQQLWLKRASSVSDKELAAMGHEERIKTIKHLSL